MQTTIAESIHTTPNSVSSLTYIFAPILSLAYFPESNVGTGIFIQPQDDTWGGDIKSLICHAGYTGTQCETGEGLGLSKLLLYFTMLCFALPCLAVPCLALPCLALPSLA